jgi:hypothetical protein
MGSKKQVNADFSIPAQQQLLRSHAETSQFTVLDECVEVEAAPVGHGCRLRGVPHSNER